MATVRWADQRRHRRTMEPPMMEPPTVAPSCGGTTDGGTIVRCKPPTVAPPCGASHRRLAKSIKSHARLNAAQRKKGTPRIGEATTPHTARRRHHVAHRTEETPRRTAQPDHRATTHSKGVSWIQWPWSVNKIETSVKILKAGAQILLFFMGLFDNCKYWWVYASRYLHHQM